MTGIRAARLPRGLLFWTLAALAVAAAAWQFLGRPVEPPQSYSIYADRGETLYHAVRDKAVSFNMPLANLLVAAAEYHLRFDPALLARAAGLLLLLPAFAIGARGGGPARGALFALSVPLSAAGARSHDFEQALYSLFLLAFLAAELRRQERGGVPSSALSGLAAGATFLLRPPLALFPPLAALFQRAVSRPPARKWLLWSAVFLFCAYLPLAPWVRLNYGLFGRFIPFDADRATCNVITGAAGIVYTIEGDARAFAGLAPGESPYPWAVRKVLGDPAAYALSVARRLWQVFLMFPVLFLLGAAGLFLRRRDRDARFLAFFGGYMLLLHCLLSIEERYFFPLRLALGLLAAGGAWELAKRYAGGDCSWRDRVTVPLAAALLIPAAWCLALVLRYPGAAEPGLIALQRELAKDPADPWLHKKKSALLLALDLTGPGLDALAQACRAGGDAGDCWTAEALSSPEPARLPETGGRYGLALLKALRELELGRAAAAREAFEEAYADWDSGRNGIRAIPYSSDLAHQEKVRGTNLKFWDLDIYTALRHFRPESRAGILAGLARLTPLTPKLRAVMLSGKPRLSPRESAELAELLPRVRHLLQESEFDWNNTLRSLTAELLRGGPAAPAGAAGELGLLLALEDGSGAAAGIFDTHCEPCRGPALRAAAEALISSGEVRAAAARRLAAADPGNFAYTLAALKAGNFSRPDMEAAAKGPARRPGTLAAGALAWALRGGREEAARLARDAAAGRLSEAEWSTVFLAMETSGDYAYGLELAEKALKDRPGSSVLLNNRGVLRKRAGDDAGAMADFEAAVKAGPGNFSALMNLGAALEAAGEAGGAADAYLRARAAAPSPPQGRDAERALARARRGAGV